MLLVTGIIPTSSTAYPWFTAIHLGFICSAFWCLLLNGFVGFQFAEDGTPLSLWSILISTFIWFLITGFLAIGTFKGVAGLSYTNQAALLIFSIVLNYTMFFIYIVSQIVLVVNTLEDQWPMGDILFAAGFFTIGQILIRYVFGAICNLLVVMMFYKYWDSITKEDLEFSVRSKQNAWEAKELIVDEAQYTNAPPQQYHEPHPF